jgi:hypothetical protein
MMSGMRAIVVIVSLVAGAVWTGSAYGNHSFPATYSGTIAGGGMVEFDVSADGTAVTRFKTLDVVRNACTFSDMELVGRYVITDHAFQGGDASLSFNGAFNAVQAAQGTVTVTRPPVPPQPSCTSGQLTWTATTTVPPPAGTPPPAPPPATDTTAPRMSVAAASPQPVDSKGRIALRVGCPDEACRATAQGTVSVPGSAATFRLKAVTAGVVKGQRARLALKLPSEARAAVRRALAKGRRVSARVTVTVVDAAGNRSQAKRTIRLRR